MRQIKNRKANFRSHTCNLYFIASINISKGPIDYIFSQKHTFQSFLKSTNFNFTKKYQNQLIKNTKNQPIKVPKINQSKVPKSTNQFHLNLFQNLLLSDYLMDGIQNLQIYHATEKDLDNFSSVFTSKSSSR